MIRLHEHHGDGKDDMRVLADNSQTSKMRNTVCSPSGGKSFTYEEKSTFDHAVGQGYHLSTLGDPSAPFRDSYEETIKKGDISSTGQRLKTNTSQERVHENKNALKSTDASILKTELDGCTSRTVGDHDGKNNTKHRSSTGTVTTLPAETSSMTLCLSGLSSDETLVINLSDGCDSDTGNDKEPKNQRKNEKKISFWNEIVYDRMTRYGILHVKTAQSLIELGIELMNCNQFDASFVSFEQSVQIFRSQSDDFKVAKALDLIGVLGCNAYRKKKEKKYIIRAKEALKEAYTIRCKYLGSDHIDTIETLNKIAVVYLNMKLFNRAEIEFQKVLSLRKAVYGTDHPCVAITERSLGRIYAHLRKDEEARYHLVNALRIFENDRGLKKHNFIDQVKRILQDIGIRESRLEI